MKLMYAYLGIYKFKLLLMTIYVKIEFHEKRKTEEKYVSLPRKEILWWEILNTTTPTSLSPIIKPLLRSH